MSDLKIESKLDSKNEEDAIQPLKESKSQLKKQWKHDLEKRGERREKLKERRRQKKETKSVGFFLESLKQTDYYFENGLRKVYPYEFSWQTTAKERWFGRTLLDVYKSEFNRAVINQSVENLILTGKIRVNDQIKPLDYKIKNGDRVSVILSLIFKLFSLYFKA